MSDNIELKQGLAYISDRGSQFRYANEEGKEQWVAPMSRYKALCPIMRGQVVSVASFEDLRDKAMGSLNLSSENIYKEEREINEQYYNELLEDPSPYVLPSNSLRHEKCVGLAMETVNEGEELHVMNLGKFDYDSRYNGLDGIEEYDPHFTYNMVGKKVFVKYPEDDGHGNLLCGRLTTDEEEAYKYNHYIIQVGYLSDAPVDDIMRVKSDGTTEKGQTITSIEVNIQGDQRGPLENTQFEVTLGEDIIINELDPIRFLALGQDEEKCFSGYINFTPQNSSYTDKDFIALQKMDGRTAFIYVVDNGVGQFDLSAPDNYEDKAFIAISQSYWELGGHQNEFIQNGSIQISLNDLQDEASVEKNMSLLKTALMRAYNFIMGESDLNKGSITITNERVAESSNNDGYFGSFVFSANTPGGHFTFYISSGMQKHFDGSTMLSPGSLDNRGMAVLADIRIASRRDILGVYYGGRYTDVDIAQGKSNPLVRGFNTKVLRMGQIPIPQGCTQLGGFEKGCAYYLGYNGKCVKFPYTQYDYINKLAYVKDERNLLVDVGRSTRRFFSGDLPIGYMKPSSRVGSGFATDYGFVLMDGNTILSKEPPYDGLYTRLLGWFSQNDIEVDDTHFHIPRVTRTLPDMVNGGNEDIPMQIKYAQDGIYEQIPRLHAFKRKFGQFAPETEGEDIHHHSPVRCIIEDVDISDIIDYGVNDNSYPVPDPDCLEIRLWVDPNPNYTSGAHDWREIHEGFFNYNNSSSYGFRWIITRDREASLGSPYGGYTLSMDIGESEGVAYVSDKNQAPQKLHNCHYKLYISRRETFPRQFDIEKLFSTYLTGSVYHNGGVVMDKAVTGKAVLDAIKKEMGDMSISSLHTETDASVALGGEDALTSSLSLGTSDTLYAVGEKGVYISESFDSSKPHYVLKDGNLSRENGDESESIYSQNSPLPDGYIPSKEQVLEHHRMTIDDKDYASTYGDKSSDKGKIHGMVFGEGGNVDASSLMHLFPMQNEKTSAHDIKTGEAYISYRRKDPSSGKWLEDKEGRENYVTIDSFNEEMTIASREITYNWSTSSGELSLSEDMFIPEKLEAHDVNGFKRRFFRPDSSTSLMEIAYNFSEHKVKFSSNTDMGVEVLSDLEFGNAISGSLSKYKRIHGERVRDESLFTSPLDANSIKYNVNFSVSGTGMENMFLSVLGSALQAAYEMPLAYWQYNTEHEWFKDSIGVIVERVNDVIDNFSSSLERDIWDSPQLYKDDPSFGRRNSYTYTQKEVESIREYLNSIIDNSSKGQNITSSVGMLFAAAKETQERLLKLEASTFGRDYKEIPGGREEFEVVGMPGVLPEPTTFGLNRLIRAICVELYNSPDPFDSSTLSNSNKTVTSLSRLDKIDREIEGACEEMVDNTSTAQNDVMGIESSSYPYPDVVFSEDAKALRAKPYFDPQDVNVKNLGENVVTRIRMKDSSSSNRFNDSSKDGIFNGMADALYRITAKVNALTENVNNSDNIMDTPVRLNTIRQNIEHMIREAYFDDMDEYSSEEKGIILDSTQKYNREEFSTEFIGQEFTVVEASPYHDIAGENNAPYKKDISRMDKLTENLYGILLHTSVSQREADTEFGGIIPMGISGREYYYTQRLFNGKPLLLKRLPNDTSDEYIAEFHIPENLKEYEFANIIDIIMDAIGCELFRKNSSHDTSHTQGALNRELRHNETISSRLDNIEEALDKLTMKISRQRSFEQETSINNNLTDVSKDGSEQLVYSVDRYMDFLNEYLGYFQTTEDDYDSKTIDRVASYRSNWHGGVGGGNDGNLMDVLKSEMFSLTSNSPVSAEYALSYRKSVHGGMVNMLYRIQEQEAKIALYDAILGIEFDSSVPTATTVKYDGVNVNGVQVTTAVSPYTLTDDVRDLLRTIYGYDIGDEDYTTGYMHRSMVENSSVYDRFVDFSYPNDTENEKQPRNIIEMIIREMYFLPKPLIKDSLGNILYTGISSEHDDLSDSRSASHYEFDSKEYVWDIKNGENALNNQRRFEFFNDIPQGFKDPSLGVTNHYRKSRFEVIEDEIRHIRNLIGLNDAWKQISSSSEKKYASSMVYDGILIYTGIAQKNAHEEEDSTYFNGYNFKFGQDLGSSSYITEEGSTNLLRQVIFNDRAIRQMRKELGFTNTSEYVSRSSFAYKDSQLYGITSTQNVAMDTYYDPSSYYIKNQNGLDIGTWRKIYDRVSILEQHMTILDQWADSVKNIDNISDEGHGKNTGNIFDIISYIGNYTWASSEKTILTGEEGLRYVGEFGLLDKKDLRLREKDEEERYENLSSKVTRSVNNVSMEIPHGEVDSHHEAIKELFDIVGIDEASEDDKKYYVPEDYQNGEGRSLSRQDTLWARINSIEAKEKASTTGSLLAPLNI